MSEKRAGGILVSSFVAGTLLAAAIFAPGAWEPVPGPYFGLDDKVVDHPRPHDAPGPGIEAAHAELSARAQIASSALRSGATTPVVRPLDMTSTAEAAMQPTASTATDTVAGLSPTATTLDAAPLQPVSEHVQSGSLPSQSATMPASVPDGTAVSPPVRVALADAAASAAAVALAQALPSRSSPPLPTETGLPAGPSETDRGTPEMAPITVPPAAAPPMATSQSGTPPTEVPADSLKAMINRRQAAQPGEVVSPPAVQPPDTVAAAPAPEPFPVEPNVPAVRSWSQTLAESRPADAAPRDDGHSKRDSASQPRPLQPAFGSNSLGAAPLPGGPWTDPDAANWSEIPSTQPATDGSRRLGWLPDRAGETRPEDDGEKRVAKGPLSGRFFERFRGTAPRVARLPDAAAQSATADAVPPDIGQWPRPVRLQQQFEYLVTLAGSAGRVGETMVAWTEQARGALDAVLETRGPRDTASDASLVSLGEQVMSGMSLADTNADAALASHTRRASLAIARRVAVWRAAAALCVEVQRSRDTGDAYDAATAMTHQAAGRAVAEIARLLDAIERFETDPTASDALVVKTALGSVGGFYPTASQSLVRAVEDHYVAPNVRIVVHQQFLEKLLPGATVDTAPFQDVVLGREVRGTRRVERTTTLRLVPDDDEISFNLEVHGDIASRSTTESGPVSVTARSASAFTVRKPIKISSQGLLFGDAAGVASNRSRVDNIQTSFDSMPMMGSLVRNIARNQQADAMPEANREVIDKIVSRACREVDSQSEPQFAEMAERVRDRVWMPLVNLGLEPKAVALETSTTLATMRLRLAAATQLAAHTPRPRAPVDAMLSAQVHESSVNNVVDRLGIAGRRLTIEELIRMVCAKVGAEPTIPDDLPEGVAVAFADVQPLRVECRDGLVHVRVKLDSIESGRRDWVGIVAHVAYRPVCNGPQVFLERDGPIRLSGPGHEGRMELALRTIFGKIFPKERPIALLPQQIIANPRLTGVQAVQAVSSDGWLAVALQQVTVAKPADQPADQRAAEVRRKIIFR